MVLEFELPYAVSVNAVWRTNASGRVYLTPEAREWRIKAVSVIRNLCVETVTARCKLKIDAYPPDYRRRDIGNLVKATEDALVHGKLLKDDEQIDSLLVNRCAVVPGGRLVLKLIW